MSIAFILLLYFFFQPVHKAVKRNRAYAAADGETVDADYVCAHLLLYIYLVICYGVVFLGTPGYILKSLSGYVYVHFP